MSTLDAPAAQSGTPATVTPIQIPEGAFWVEVQGAWDSNADPVYYSIQASPPQVMGVVLRADTVAATQVTTPSGQTVSGMQGPGFFQQVPEAGEYQIMVQRSHMGTGTNGSFTLLVVLGTVY